MAGRGAPFGHPKYPGSGRPRGSPNKRSESLLEKCTRLGIDPFMELLNIALTAPELHHRIEALKEVCTYIYPKRKALEITAEIDIALVERAKELKELPRAELLKLAAIEIDKLKVVGE